MTSTITTPFLGRPRLISGSLAARRARASRTKTIVGVVVAAVVIVPVVLAPWLPIADPLAQDLSARLQPPGSSGHLLGTDQLGRDLLSRMLFGGRVSLTIGVLAVIVSGVVGLLAGVLAGYFGGVLDTIVSRLIEAQLSLPLLMMLLLVTALFGPSITVITLVLAFAQWPETARIARSLTLVEREKLYVDAAKLVGGSWRTVIGRHLMPNILGQVLIVVLLLLAQAVLLESSLSYLGLGVSRPNPTWGRIIADGQGLVTTAWWLVTMPGLAISMLVVGVNLFGEGLRETLTKGNG